MRAVNPRLAAFVGEEMDKHADPAVVSSRLCAMIGGEPDAQDRELEMIRISDRLNAVVERLSNLLARMTARPGDASN